MKRKIIDELHLSKNIPFYSENIFLGKLGYEK
jgi:hypothetical protein